MDQHGEVHEMPVPAQHWAVIVIYGLAGLFVCLNFGIEGAFLGLVLLYGLWGLLEKISNAFTKPTVARGKYIAKEVNAYTDAPKGAPQHPAVVVERVSKEPLAWVPYQQFSQQRQSSDRTKASERASSSMKQLETVKWSEGVVGKVQSHLKAAALEGPSKIERAITEGPTDDRAWVDEIVREIGLEAIEAPAYGQHSIEVESDAPLQTVPLAIESPSDGLPSPISDSADSFMSSETTAPKSKVQRTVRERAAKLRFRREKKSRVARAPTRRGKGKKERATRPQRLVDEGSEAGVAMVGLEFTGGDTESVEEGEPMDLRPDDSAIDIDAVMIGSDVDGEMEIEGETPDSDGDSGFVDGKPSQLAARRITKVGSIEKKPKCDHDKVFYGRVGREKAGIPFQHTPRSAVSGPVVAPAQPSQQQAAPIPAPATCNTDANLLQGVAQNLVPTNSAADLREARLGKRSEARVAPRVSTTCPIQTPPANSSSPKGAMPGNGDSSDSTQPTTTPTMSLPSSTASSAPASPLVRDLAPTTKGSPRVCGNGTNSGEAKDDRKKRQGSGPSIDASEPSPEKASKRVQQRRGNAAEADAEIIPLNELPDRVPTAEEINQQQLTAVFDNFNEADFSDTDLDFTTEEDEPADTRGRKARDERKKREGKGKGQKDGKGTGKGKEKETGGKDGRKG